MLETGKVLGSEDLGFCFGAPEGGGAGLTP